MITPKSMITGLYLWCITCTPSSARSPDRHMPGPPATRTAKIEF